MKYLTALAFLFLLVGCTSGTYKELKNSPVTKYDFHADMNYQAVYRTVLAKMRECHQVGMLTAQILVQGELYTDIEQAEITASMQGGLGTDVFLGVDIEKVEKNKSRVTVFSGIRSWNKSAQAVQEWVESDYQGCQSPG